MGLLYFFTLELVKGLIGINLILGPVVLCGYETWFSPTQNTTDLALVLKCSNYNGCSS
jgi:hypothetical protein